MIITQLGCCGVTSRLVPGCPRRLVGRATCSPLPRGHRAGVTGSPRSSRSCWSGVRVFRRSGCTICGMVRRPCRWRPVTISRAFRRCSGTPRCPSPPTTTSRSTPAPGTRPRRGSGRPCSGHRPPAPIAPGSRPDAGEWREAQPDAHTGRQLTREPEPTDAKSVGSSLCGQPVWVLELRKYGYTAARHPVSPIGLRCSRLAQPDPTSADRQ